MKRLHTILLSAALLAALAVTPAHALEYTVDAPDDYLFGKPTSDDTLYEQEDPNVDRSKNIALVPGALEGGGLVTSTGSAASYPTVSAGISAWTGTAFTSVTDDLYYSGGHLGTLKIPAIGLTVKVYEGTGSSTLAKGVGHFTDTSIWDGNCCLAAHNRGTNSYFGDIHTLTMGDTITWTTKLGTRTYEVVSVSKVKEADTGGTAATSDNRLTLYTCVRDERDYRWMVQAVER